MEEGWDVHWFDKQIALGHEGTHLFMPFGRFESRPPFRTVYADMLPGRESSGSGVKHALGTSTAPPKIPRQQPCSSASGSDAGAGGAAASAPSNAASPPSKRERIVAQQALDALSNRGKGRERGASAASSGRRLDLARAQLGHQPRNDLLEPLRLGAFEAELLHKGQDSVTSPLTGR